MTLRLISPDPQFGSKNKAQYFQPCGGLGSECPHVNSCPFPSGSQTSVQLAGSVSGRTCPATRVRLWEKILVLSTVHGPGEFWILHPSWTELPVQVQKKEDENRTASGPDSQLQLCLS